MNVFILFLLRFFACESTTTTSTLCKDTRPSGMALKKTITKGRAGAIFGGGGGGGREDAGCSACDSRRRRATGLWLRGAARAMRLRLGATRDDARRDAAVEHEGENSAEALPSRNGSVPAARSQRAYVVALVEKRRTTYRRRHGVEFSFSFWF